MEIKYEIITPEIAKNCLEKNYGNYRKPVRSKVESYAKDMSSGNWKNNGESIKFSKSGKLVDGQHRLMAIVMSGSQVPMFVVYGIDDDVDIFDIGMVRTTSQILSASGVAASASNNTTAGAVSLFLGGTLGDRQFRTPRSGVAKPEIVNYTKLHESDLSSAYLLTDVASHKTGLCRKSSCVLVSYCLIRIGENKDEIKSFFKVVNSGFPTDERECSSAIVFRNLLLENRKQSRSPHYAREMEYITGIASFFDYKEGVKRKLPYRRDKIFPKGESILNAVRMYDDISFSKSGENA